MNEDQNKSSQPNQPLKLIAGNAIPTTEEHPLHVLHNQIDPELKKKLDIPQESLRTYENDLGKALSHLDKSQVPKKFMSFFGSAKTENQPQKPKLNPLIIETQQIEQKIPEKAPLPKVDKQKIPTVAGPGDEDNENPEYTFNETSDTKDFKNLEKKPQVIPRPPQPIVREAVPEVKLPERLQPAQPKLRTYEGDIAGAMANKQSSVLSIVIAENRRKMERAANGEDVEEDKPPSQFGRKLLVVFISILFIAGGIGGGYYLYLKSPLAVVPVVATKPIVPSIIKPDSQNIVSIPSLKKEQLTSFIVNQFNTQKVSAGKIIEIVPEFTSDGSKNKLTGSEFIAAMNFDITDTLKRSLIDQWMLGVYSSNGREVSTNLPFIILTTDFFQNSYAGMLKWEPSMPEDLADLLSFRQQATSSITSLYNFKGTFKDKVIANRDIREFLDQSGNILFLYSFIDKNTLIITTSEDVIPELLDRIEKQTYMR